MDVFYVSGLLIINVLHKSTKSISLFFMYHVTVDLITIYKCNIFHFRIAHLFLFFNAQTRTIALSQHNMSIITKMYST